MAIPQSFIQQLLQQCDIEDVIASYVTLRSEGSRKKALCPFHSEKTPSFIVYPNTQSFYCFGCGAGGDVITFIRRIENLDYVEAVKLLAQRAGMTVPEDAESDRAGKLKVRILEINREAARFFHQTLKTPDGQPGLRYLKGERKLSDHTIVKYGLGYARNSWDALYRHLRSKGYTVEELEAAKVISRGKNGHYYDFFRNRVIYPVIDLRGNVIAFGGRVLDDSKPKYLNTPDTPVFKKSRNLFSLNFAKNAVSSKRLILAEGYMDVIAIHAAGFENVVATLGTALTADQARLMKNYADEVIICYDSDGPGQAATHRAINLLSEVGLTAKTIRMEGAKDPDEFIKKFGAKRFELLLNGAGNAVEFELRKIREQVDLNDTNGKIEYIRRAVPLIADIQSRLEREVYAGIVSRETGVDAKSFLSQVDAAIRRKARKQEDGEWRDIYQAKDVRTDRVNPDRAKFLRASQAEATLIALAVRDPSVLTIIQSRLKPEDFPTAFNRRVYERVLWVTEQFGDCPPALLNEPFSEPEVDRISQILAAHAEDRMSDQLLNDCIAVLEEQRRSLRGKDTRTMSLEELEARRKQRQKQE